MPLKEATGKGALSQQDVAQVPTMIITERQTSICCCPLLSSQGSYFFKQAP